MRISQMMAAIMLLAGFSVSAAEWSKTIEKVAPSIVSIQLDAVRSFDTEWNASAQGTGFVVDAKNGIILTNRHIVTSGPVTAQAVFRNHEVVDLVPVYRDPVHDFGLFRYDPAKLRYISPSAIPLRPDRAVVGREIRVIGNDAGEQLSILAGTLARLDREAPDYGRGNYNDFNTFYIQAASSTSGGSSGSPVIDIDGNAVALNAGGRSDAASSFYLPLQSVVRALDYVRNNTIPPRGSLQTTFRYLPFDELGRLGLSAAVESKVRRRFPGDTGMLVVDLLQPGSPASVVLQPGDILVSINQAPLVGFPALETVLDAHVGKTITLEFERGGTLQTADITVTDLHAITPAEFIEFGGGVVHELSYQQARNLYREQTGIYVANPGYVLGKSGIPRGAVITKFNDVDTGTLEDFLAQLVLLHQDQRIRIEYFNFSEPRRPIVSTITMDWRWFPARQCRRNDARGKWDCQLLSGTVNGEHQQPATLAFPEYGDKILNRIARSMVYVQFDMPYLVNGIGAPNYFGTGLVVDHEQGLVVVDRNTVPAAMGDVRLIFAGSVEVPATVRYIHPLHNLAVLAYDPALLGSTEIASAELLSRNVEPGDHVRTVGFRPNQTLRAQNSVVQDRSPLIVPLSSSFQFRESNLIAINLETPPEGDGLLIDDKGRVLALWSSFAQMGNNGLSQRYAGVPAEYVAEITRLARQGTHATLRSLEAEFYFMSLASARKLGLPDEWAKRIERSSRRDRRVLAVARMVAGTPADELLEQGDLVLAANGDVVTDFRQLEVISQQGDVLLTLLRDGAVIELPVPTVALDGSDTDRLLIWAGAQLHEPHRAVAAQRGIERSGLLVAYFTYGSPASHYGLTPGRRIVAVDGMDIETMDDFIALVSGKSDGDAVRLETVTWDGRVEVVTLKLDEHYWPQYQLVYREGVWQRIGP